LNRSSRSQLWVLFVLCGSFCGTLVAQADAVSVVQVLREGGCGGTVPPTPLLHPSTMLDQAAQQWATGRSLSAATELSGYQAEATAGLHIRGPDSSVLQLIRKSECRTVADKRMHDIGVYRHGQDTWLVLAAAYVTPAPSRAPMFASRALQLVNEVRARGARCGERSFAPAGPVKLSGTLVDVALGHASDMAKHNYFEHEDLSGHSPADRVRAVGYREKLVGENIAYGPKSADEVVQGWLDSPGHCENIMDPRFEEMGIAYAAGQVSKHGLYWVQVLAAPRVETRARVQAETRAVL
jgi:uncharacterized protein YkwD